MALLPLASSIVNPCWKLNSHRKRNVHPPVARNNGRTCHTTFFRTPWRIHCTLDSTEPIPSSATQTYEHGQKQISSWRKTHPVVRDLQRSTLHRNYYGPFSSLLTVDINPYFYERLVLFVEHKKVANTSSGFLDTPTCSIDSSTEHKLRYFFLWHLRACDCGGSCVFCVSFVKILSTGISCATEI